ncbi:MAG: hypothetical protein WCA52_08835 [Candidatus Aquilonibacter sp.]
MNRALISLPALVMAGVFAVSGPAMASNPTVSGTLGVSATVASSISMTFVTDASGVALGGTGTNAATLAFGSIQAYGGVVPTNATRTVNGTTSFTYSSPFDINVAEENSASATYTLAAALGATSPDTFAVDATTLSTSSQTITATGAYASNAVHTLALTVPFSVASGTVINSNVNFTATAN